MQHLARDRDIAEAFARVGLSDDAQAEPSQQPEPPPHTRIPEGADAEPDPTPAPKGLHKDPPKIEIATLPPLTVPQWRERDLPAAVLLMGEWLSTTSRILITAATGLGKTNFGLALAMRCADSLDFLHWKAHRKARVLYVDGEMSRRLLRDRVLAEAQRIGADPEAFFALSHQDIPGGMRALNTPEGQAWLNAFIEKIGGVDLILFDNIMSLTTGDQKDSEPWLQTLPLVLSLTGRDIGQVWIHHTGHDESRSYGDKTREWQMDAVAHFDRVEREDTDISFSMKFEKARERTPQNRDDFQDVKIALVNDQWEHELSRARRPDKISPRCQKALEALLNVLAGDQATMLPGNRKAAHRDHWQAECTLLGLIDIAAKPHSARTLFATFRRELVASNRIACEGDMTWII